jgi:hypothetical protein
MTNNGVDVLQVDELPSDPKEMALRLLGMTVAELKGIDEKVVSGRNYVGGLRTDVNKIVQDFNQNLKPQTQSIPIQSIPTQSMQHVPLAQPFPTSNPVPQLEVATIAKDDNQLEFDFYRKVKPEDIEYRLKMIESKIEDVESKLDSMLVLIKKNYQSLNGNHSQ